MCSCRFLLRTTRAPRYADHRAGVSCVVSRTHSKMYHRIKLLLVCTAAVTMSCRSSTGPVSTYVGIYELEAVDGKRVPVQVMSQGGCSRTVTTGFLSLGPKGLENEPLFAWQVRANDECLGRPIEPVFAAFDHGLWSTDGKTLTFDPASGSRYRGAGDPNISPIAVDLTYQGLVYRFRFVSLNPT